MNDRFDHNFSSCSRTYATLCIYHDKLGIDDIQIDIDLLPDKIITKGERVGLSFARKNGWLLGTGGRVKSKDLRAHIQWIINRISDKKSEFIALKQQGFEIRISCLWISAVGNGGPLLDHKMISDLAELPVDLHFDIWFEER